MTLLHTDKRWPYERDVLHGLSGAAALGMATTRDWKARGRPRFRRQPPSSLAPCRFESGQRPQRSERRIALHATAVALPVNTRFSRDMGKYDPLRNYLKRQRVNALELTFVEIERTLGSMLPKKSSHPEWWSDDADQQDPQVQTEAWRAAGFHASLIPGKERVHFARRIAGQPL